MTRHISGKRGRTATAVVAIAAASVVALSGCSGASGSSGASSGSSSSATTSVSFGVGGNIFDLPVQVANAKGYFAKEGIDPKFVTINASTGASALQSGSVQFLDASPTTLVTAKQQNLTQKAVAAPVVGNPLGIIVSKSFAAAHGLTADSSAKKVAAALDGSKGGVSSTNTQKEAALFLSENGTAPSSINWVTLPSPASDVAALKSGQIDWFLTSEPTPFQVQADGDGVVVATSKTVPAWKNSGYTILVLGKTSWLKSNSATAKKVMKAVSEANAYINSHLSSSDLLTLAKKENPSYSSDVLSDSLKSVTWPKDPSMNAAGWKKTTTFLKDIQIVTASNGITTSDWSNQYLPSAG